ncbi:MAG: hypothetical protein ACE366_28695 [Bradymonadia bacterium]
MNLQFLLIAVGVFIVIVIGILVMITRFYRKVDQGQALIVNKLKAEPEVTFTGGVVLPIVHRAETMDISVKAIEIARRGAEGLICRDNIRADIKVNFFVRVNKTTEDVLKVAQNIGCVRASDRATLEELFVAKFSEALKTVGKRLEFEELYTKREEFKDQIVEVIGRDLNGYVLDDAAIDYLEMTPLDQMDANNILDAQGIRKITEITSQQNVRTNDLKQTERMEIGRQNLASDEALFRFEQQRADAEAKKNKEVAITQAREQNEALRVQQEEGKKTAIARNKAEEEVAISAEAKARSVAVAAKAREREIGVEEVRIKKASDLEEIGREREVELRRISKEKDLEVERKDIADVVRQRIAVDKTVAEEEERIKDLRAQAEAEREKQVKMVKAEADAQEALVKEIKAAEANEAVAKFKARERLISADAEVEAADKAARAKTRLAEGVQAEQAAHGLAEVRVQEAQAAAIEKQGLAEARVTKEKMNAEAEGQESQGMARLKVRQAEVEVTEQEGMLKAKLVREQREAEANAIEQQGVAEAKVKEAHAAAIEKQGTAEAAAIREKLAAEAAGLAEKAEAMKALDGAGREHEEFRIKLEQEREIAMAKIQARVQVSEAQARVMANAFDQAKINIVGGDGQFFDRFLKAVSLGHAVDGFMDASTTAQTALGEYQDGSRSLPNDLTEILSRPAIGPEGIKDLSLVALIKKLMDGAGPDDMVKLRALLAQVQRQGIGGLSLLPAGTHTKGTPDAEG